ncbi:CDP-glucose 4,6-dehydratase [Phenylobacterium montanum]|uniref:CDP-glucose 4,6-dehydratase n=1 Tax=Phenylobacterium montanum TaxID=2823693 RepID=A0A975IU72_9CAUL|nr:CDP-glucose 4,6-dehydratase [Caulobacter sp. S6]QUD87224.1 CDP-glucose 4,6-dehydratase [Caulobacter sp. S6]
MDFWRDRRVFVTGHTGFKGGWLTALLHRLGAATTGYALAPEPGPSLFEGARIGELGTSIIADIRDRERLTAALAHAQPEVVLHLAAQPLVRRARKDPDETFETNVMGTVRLLEAIRRTPSVKAAVVVTSDKVYDNVEWPWAYRETDALGGKEPYGASKAACEIVVQAWRHAYFDEGPRIATARAGNVIGGGDWSEDRLIPDAMRAFIAGQPLVIRNPAAVRPWQHVIEPLTGYLSLAEAMLAEDTLPADMAFNFGPLGSEARPVAWIADAAAARWGDGAAWTQDPGVQPYEARLLEVDSARARAVLDWSPRWGLEEGLDRTVAWYRAVARGVDARAVTMAQIEDHLNG